LVGSEDGYLPILRGQALSGFLVGASRDRSGEEDDRVEVK
jgi:hypothetical protein